jgi:hypothetical protein
MGQASVCVFSFTELWFLLEPLCFASPKSSSLTTPAVPRMFAGFEVAMNDSLAVRGLKRSGNLHS